MRRRFAVDVTDEAEVERTLLALTEGVSAGFGRPESALAPWR